MMTNKGAAGFSLNGVQLKGIAMAAMLVDHLALFVLAAWMQQSGAPEKGGLTLLFHLLRAVGRIAFPLYFFLLVEGFLYTRSIRRYLTRLLLFGLISEIPYDLANCGRLLDWSRQNIFFTLAIGLFTLSLLEHYQNQPLLRASALAGGCLLALLLRTEYHMMGILLMTAFRLLHENPTGRTLAAGAMLACETYRFWCAGLAALIPIGCYSGVRGELRHPLFFYWFYPIHIALLYVVRRVLLGL